MIKIIEFGRLASYVRPVANGSHFGSFNTRKGGQHMSQRGKILASIMSLGMLTACGRDNQDVARSNLDIVGGTLVNAASAITKSTVALIDMTTGNAFCTGSLIGARTVLTAAHCVEGVAQTSIRVGVSFGVKASNARAIPVLQLTKHPSYNTAMMQSINPDAPPNDIALATLAEAAPAGYKPVAILGLTDRVVVGEALLLAGYGLTSPSGADLSGRLRQVTTEVTMLSEVRKELEFGNHPGKSACMGDSGGPAFVIRAGQIKLLGVTSRGSSACNLRGVYTDVRYFAPFLASKL